MFKIKVELKMTLTDDNNNRQTVVLNKKTETEASVAKIKIVFSNILKMYSIQSENYSTEIIRKYIDKTKS